MITPVVIVSGSENPKEVREAYELHASCYVRKPTDLNEFLFFIETYCVFGGKIVTFPPRDLGAEGGQAEPGRDPSDLELQRVHTRTRGARTLACRVATHGDTSAPTDGNTLVTFHRTTCLHVGR